MRIRTLATTCGIEKPSRRLLCWGNSENKQLGTGKMLFATSEVTEATALSRGQVSQIFGLYDGFCSLLLDESKLICFGRVPGKRLVGSSTEFIFQPNERVKFVSSGNKHLCISFHASSSRCIGSGFYRQLGRLRDASTLQEITGLVSRDYVAGLKYTCGLSQEGYAFCVGLCLTGLCGEDYNVQWPNERNGQRGSDFLSREWRQVTEDEKIDSLAIGNVHACGLSTRGKILCWGQGLLGQLGAGRKESRPTPRAITL